MEARITGAGAPVIAAVRHQLQEIDSNVALLRTRTMEEYVNATMQRERLVAYLSGFFGVLALGLAGLGLYGLMANAVSRRTKELGIRMALGARVQDVMAMVIIESLTPVSIGVIVGIAGALVSTRLVTGLLYGVAPQDPVSIGIAAATMLAVAALAAPGEPRGTADRPAVRVTPPRRRLHNWSAGSGSVPTRRQSRRTSVPRGSPAIATAATPLLQARDLHPHSSESAFD
jgi:predicted lysophospholipase L1 biosynthesis ABC-type transport system permease subunit